MKHRNPCVGAIRLATLAVVPLLWGWGAPAAADAPVPRVEINRDYSDRCVEDTDFMRRNHMKLLLHQRDETMHQGIRTKKYSLKNCINCHASKKTNSVLGEQGFCQSCHRYAAVTMDCFSCHSDKREPGATPVLSFTGPNPHHPAFAYKPVASLKDLERAMVLDTVIPSSGHPESTQ